MRESDLHVRSRKTELRIWSDTELERALDLEWTKRRQWPAFVADVQKLVESSAVDPTGRFVGCTAAYLWPLGDQRAAQVVELPRAQSELASVNGLAADLRVRVDEERTAHQATQRLLEESLARAIGRSSLCSGFQGALGPGKSISATPGGEQRSIGAHNQKR